MFNSWRVLRVQQPCSNLSESPEHLGKALRQKYSCLQGFCKLQKPLANYCTAFARRRAGGQFPSTSLQKWRRRVGSSLAATLVVSMQSVDRMVHVAEARVDLPVNLAKEGIVQ